MSGFVKKVEVAGSTNSAAAAYLIKDGGLPCARIGMRTHLELGHSDTRLLLLQEVMVNG